MGYFYLMIAIVGEVVGTISLKNSRKFTQPIPSSPNSHYWLSDSFLLYDVINENNTCSNNILCLGWNRHHSNSHYFFNKIWGNTRFICYNWFNFYNSWDFYFSFIK